jgi:Tfp pilus assembly protein FimT
MLRAWGMHRRHGAGGFAVIEWLLALAIASSIVAVAAGPWRRWWVGVALARAEHAMLTSLAIARHAALRHNRPIEVCRADADGRCASKALKDASGRDVASTDWPYGWLVVVERPPQDEGGTTRPSRDATRGRGPTDGDDVLVLHRVDAMRGVRVSSSMSNGRLLFRPPLGLTVGRWGRIMIAPDIPPAQWSTVRDGPLAVRCVVIGGAGRARVVRGPRGDCR